ncbi:ABC transporter ATP-binding protein [Paludisphaera rhizosphaerae]|uniref:ABC transporter ATP-binding protein n=1 Tax=Paludisphaera rhizosphaerae TaxID=2711216 RepID=UPI0013EC3F7C|nr:ATP-binding cassette domain-containing protein [Paludisphaera rhizosphaerae]
MIEVQRLSKSYGALRALDQVSFALGRGEIAGLLGPNGAGKTTTMRILTTFLAPTSGRAAVGGHDVLDEPLAVRRSIGYLPENVPLYPEMRVRELLTFRAKLKDVPRSERRRAVSSAIARCGLGEVERRPIGKLSRGFRQRVGLADAIVHSPPVLILDEPTAGMDPIQVREVRALIRELAERHTVLLSTHIMSEVEAVCDRVVIIARGRIALDGRLSELRGGDALRVEARGPADLIRKALATVPGVASVRIESDSDGIVTLDLSPKPGDDPREMIAAKLVASGWPLRALEARRRSLEERFVEAVTRTSFAVSDREAG